MEINGVNVVFWSHNRGPRFGSKIGQFKSALGGGEPFSKNRRTPKKKE